MQYTGWKTKSKQSPAWCKFGGKHTVFKKLTWILLILEQKAAEIGGGGTYQGQLAGSGGTYLEREAGSGSVSSDMVMALPARLGSDIIMLHHHGNVLLFGQTV